MNVKRLMVALAGGALYLSISVAAVAQLHDPRALEADPATADAPIAPMLAGLGDYEFDVSTDNERSQYFFNQGLRLTYGFNHSEALRAFKEAARLDHDNAMAYWGWALVLGPNLNLPMQPQVVEQAYKAIQEAQAHKNSVSERERAYIDALATRYSENPEADRAALDAAYAAAMSELTKAYPDDLDAATLYAASLMNLSPWNYWSRNGTPYPRTELLIAALESVMERNPEHPGAAHYYIHAVEAVWPQSGVAAADTLRELMPGAGHMVHMPSHIYMRVGRYADSVAVNQLAAQADERYIASCRAQGIYPVNYYPHNVHFLVWAAMSQGSSAIAMEAARKIQISIPEALDVEDELPNDVYADAWILYETFLTQPLFAMARFGWWDQVLAEPQPPDEARYMTGVWHYARGLAYVHTGSRGKAGRELKQLQVIIEEPGTRDYPVSANGGYRLLTMASEILAGEIAASKKNYTEALAHLERAVRLQDGFFYIEPPDWYFSARHILGAVLLEAGYPDEAETVYWADLQRNPENGYALFGLMQSLKAQAKNDAAASVESRFRAAWSDADVQLTSSRY
jgi:tetratricopeptide (TPR) repeat protein